MARWLSGTLLVGLMVAIAAGQRPTAQAGTPVDLRRAIDAVLNARAIAPNGQKYVADVPDTLDLAERAALSMNVMLGNIDAAKQYSVYQGFTVNANPPKPNGLTWNIQHKNLRALPMLRTMTGSDRGLALELAAMKNILDQIGPNGLIYFPIGGDNVPPGTSAPLINGLAAIAMETWHLRDHNPAWLDLMQVVSKGLDAAAIRRDDRAYYPLESGIDKAGQWRWSLRGPAITPYSPPDEPVLDYQGAEGAVKFDSAVPMRAMIRTWQYRQDPRVLETAWRISRYLRKPSMWMQNASNEFLGHERATFNGHFHGNVTPLHALFDLGSLTGTHALQEFAQRGYEHGRNAGVARMGFFPGWYLPLQCDRPDSLSAWAEGCGISDMLVLAVKLTDAGLGDYWDDVDAYLRNQLISQQFADLDQMRALSGNDPKNDPLLKQYLGGFGAGEPTVMTPSVYGCCSANGAIGLYYAWHGVTRFEKGIAQVNLFLNRASPWMDVESYLPYEGKVLLRNKQARTAWVRVPAWVNAAKLVAYQNDVRVTPARFGNRLIFEGLAKGDVVRLEFPNADEVVESVIHGVKYTVTYRGSTVVDISPRDKRPSMYRLYERNGMKAKTAPTRRVERFVTDAILPLQ